MVNDGFCSLTDDERRAREYDGKESDMLKLVRKFAPRAYPHPKYEGVYWVGNNHAFPIEKVTKELTDQGLVCYRSKVDGSNIRIAFPPPPKPATPPKPSRHEIEARKYDMMVRKDCPFLFDLRKKFPRAYISYSERINGGVMTARNFFLCETGKPEDIKKLARDAVMDFCRNEIAENRIPKIPASFGVNTENTNGYYLDTWFV